MNLTILSLTSRSFPSKSIFQSLLKLLLKLHNTFSGGESLISLDSTKIKERKKIQYQFLYNKKKVTKSARNSSVTSLRPDNASLQHLYEIMTSNGPMLIVQWRFVASDNWPGKSSDISSLHPQVRVYFSFSFLFFLSIASPSNAGEKSTEYVDQRAIARANLDQTRSIRGLAVWHTCYVRKMFDCSINDPPLSRHDSLLRVRRRWLRLSWNCATNHLVNSFRGLRYIIYVYFCPRVIKFDKIWIFFLLGTGN